MKFFSVQYHPLLNSYATETYFLVNRHCNLTFALLKVSGITRN
ncbi:MAG: hypothetical protein ACOH2A_08850 [Sphingobacteriaceae bacterium]